jgi:hypothetical protein
VSAESYPLARRARRSGRTGVNTRRLAGAAGGLLAGAYVVCAALEISGPSLSASAAAVGHGRVWLLLTSALQPHPPLEVVQVGLVASAAVVLARRESIGRWWAVALAAHVGSAVIAYTAIGIAVVFGVASAQNEAIEPDYGVSCVLAGSTGALLVNGIAGLRRSRPRRTADVIVVAGSALGALAFLAVSGGWYASEHALALMIGAGTAAFLDMRRR